MPAGLIDSQFSMLEALAAAKTDALVLEGDRSVAELLEARVIR